MTPIKPTPSDEISPSPDGSFVQLNQQGPLFIKSEQSSDQEKKPNGLPYQEFKHQPELYPLPSRLYLIDDQFQKDGEQVINKFNSFWNDFRFVDDKIHCVQLIRADFNEVFTSALEPRCTGINARGEAFMDLTENYINRHLLLLSEEPCQKVYDGAEIWVEESKDDLFCFGAWGTEGQCWLCGKVFHQSELTPFSRYGQIDPTLHTPDGLDFDIEKGILERNLWYQATGGPNRLDQITLKAQGRRYNLPKYSWVDPIKLAKFCNTCVKKMKPCTDCYWDEDLPVCHLDHSKKPCKNARRVSPKF